MPIYQKYILSNETIILSFAHSVIDLGNESGIIRFLNK